jgi:hypothetical protein
MRMQIADAVAGGGEDGDCDDHREAQTLRQTQMEAEMTVMEKIVKKDEGNVEMEAGIEKEVEIKMGFEIEMDIEWVDWCPVCNSCPYVQAVQKHPALFGAYSQSQRRRWEDDLTWAWTVMATRGFRVPEKGIASVVMSRTITVTTPARIPIPLSAIRS